MFQTYPDPILFSGSDLFLPSSKKHITGTPLKILYIRTRNRELLPPCINPQVYSCRVFWSYADAVPYLLHLVNNSGQLPDAIISYHDEGDRNEMTDLTSFLLENSKLSVIPFLLIRQKQYAGKITRSREISGIDDILRDNILPGELQSKIILLKKFKSLKLTISPGECETHHIDLKHGVLNRVDFFFKRALDILVAGIALILLSPFMLLIALIIKLESRGPVFYTASRAGTNYRIFKFIKFRSMVVNADQKLAELGNLNQYGNSGNQAVFFKVSNDPRITRFGKFLRNTSLDELPQILNILKGDMSLVGNRPLPLYEAKKLTADLYAERFDAPAGLTGLWQVSKRGKKEMSVRERVALDIHYARKHSIWYDLKIILLTPMALIQKDNV